MLTKPNFHWAGLLIGIVYIVMAEFIASKVGPNQCLRMRGGGGGGRQLFCCYECTVQCFVLRRTRGKSVFSNEAT